MIFEKKVLNVKFVFWFSLQLLSETFLILRIIQRDSTMIVQSSALKYPLFLSDFNETWNTSTHFRKAFKFQISWKSIQPSYSMRTDRQKGGHERA